MTLISPFSRYVETVAPLAQRAQLWRLLLGIALVVAGQVVATVAIFSAYAYVRVLVEGISMDRAFAQVSLLQGKGSVVAMLLTFSGWTAAILIAMRLLHRSPMALIVGTAPFRDLILPALVILGTGIALVAGSSMFYAFDTGVAFGPWLFWLLPAILATLVQVSAEEVVFRGYLQGHLAARFSSPWVWMVGPSVLFGLLHTTNALPFGANAWLVVLAPTILGLAAAHLTARSGSLFPAIGLHLGNNLLGLLVVAIPGPLSQLSLFIHPIDLADVDTVRPMIIANLIFLLSAYLIVLKLLPARLQDRAEVFR